MPSRYDISEPETSQKRFPTGKHPVVDVLDSEKHASSAVKNKLSTDAPSVPDSTLSPVSASAMNTIKLVTSSEQRLATGNSTTENGQTGGKESYGGIMTSRPNERLENTASSSDRLYGTLNSHPHPMPRSPIAVSPLVRTISAEFGATRTQENAPRSGEASPQQWSSAVGKANLGKSGRVIEQLMSQNDHLRRDLQLTKLQAEESRNEAKMAQGKMEATYSDYENMARQRAVLDTILTRKERQLAEFKDQIDAERAKTQAAIDSERNWRELMERNARESRREVDEAKNYATLLEAQYKIVARHWPQEREKLESEVGKQRTVIEENNVSLRQNQVEKDKLEAMCEQKDVELRKQVGLNKALEKALEAYITEKESGLVGIKSGAEEKLQTLELKIEEATKVMGKMKWVMAVQETVKGGK